LKRELFMGDRIELYSGDSREVLRALPDCSIDSIVTDPPYALVSIVKRFGSPSAQPAKSNDAYQRASAGFMGKQWDTGETAFAVEFWAECLRVLKPGGHVVAFSGTRTYHRMAVAIEDAGFEIRDQLQWLYGSGFPKSHDVSKGIDRAAGAERIEGAREWSGGSRSGGISHGGGQSGTETRTIFDTPATDAARQWDGWGTALKPACEPICFGRKPMIGTVAANVLAHGTGAINVDGCRVGTGDKLGGGGEKAETAGKFTNEGWRRPWMDNPEQSEAFAAKVRANVQKSEALGRWPANVIHDGSEEVVQAFPDAPGQQYATGPEYDRHANVYGKFAGVTPAAPRGDSGSAARFFYTAKADANDRIGSKHPTVKPVDLMQWLVRLVTPKGGTVLDPFAGTGTTGEAAFREGMCCILIERETEYQDDIRRRMALVLAGPEERSRESIKAKLKDKPVDAGPLFGGLDTPPRTGEGFTGSSRTNNRTDRIEEVDP
jgi:DNA modification methylase